MKGRTWRIRHRKTPTDHILNVSVLSYEENKLLGRWMKEKGMRKHHLEPRNFTETGRGMMACCKIEPGDVIVSIPHQLLITIDTVLNSELGPKLKQSSVKLSLQLALTLFLLLEKQKGESSSWWPYIQTIPRNFSTPGYFTPEECLSLPQHLKNNINIHITKLRKSYRQAQTFSKDCVLNEKLCLTFKSFRWAWYAVNSRSVYYDKTCCELQEDDCNMALAPYLDLLNHSTETKSEAKYNIANNCYEIKTWNKYKKYDQVFISYGPHDNHKLFLEYGFILPNNSHSVFEFTQEDLVQFASTHNIQYLPQKLKILEGNSLNKGLACSLDGVSWKLETAVKILVMNWTQLQNWKLIMIGRMTSCELDKQVRSLIQELLTDHINKTCHQLKMQNPARTYHEEIGYNLLQEDFSILQTSIKLLQ